MRERFRNLLLILVLGLPLRAQDVRLFYSSAASMAAAQSADAFTTVHSGGVERNPLGVRGVIAAKVVLVPTLIYAERRIVRKQPRFAKAFSIINFAIAGEMSWAAWHNSRITPDPR